MIQKSISRTLCKMKPNQKQIEKNERKKITGRRIELKTEKIQKKNSFYWEADRIKNRKNTKKKIVFTGRRIELKDEKNFLKCFYWEADRINIPYFHAIAKYC